MNHKNQIHILQIVGGMNRGGIETWLMHVLRHIDRERFHMDFLVHSAEPNAYDDEVRALGSQIIPCLSHSNPWIYTRDLKRIIKEHGPYDIVHSHLYLFNGVTLRTAYKVGIKVRIAHIHTSADVKQSQRWRPIYQWLATYWISHYATHIVAASQSSLRSFASTCDFRQPTTVLYSGIDLNHFHAKADPAAIRQVLSLPLDKPIITYVARFVPLKNHAQMLRIADQLNKGGYRFHFVMAGSHGELLAYFKEITRNRQDISILEGAEIPNLLRASDLFFFPSLLEGLPLVAIEACAAGLPIVATDLSAIREACPPSYHALMFTPNDDVTACANILNVFNNEQLRKQLSADGKQWAERFLIEKSVAGLVSLYESCLEQAVRPPSA